MALGDHPGLEASHARAPLALGRTGTGAETEGLQERKPQQSFSQGDLLRSNRSAAEREV